MICHKIDIWTIFPPIYACHSKYEILNCLWLWLYEYILGNASLFPNEPQSCYLRGLHDHGLQDSGRIRWPRGHPDPDGLRLHLVRTNLALRLNFVQEYVEIVASLNSLKKQTKKNQSKINFRIILIATQIETILKYFQIESPYIEMYCEFSKNDILLMQQLKVLMANSIKTVLWNARFSRI